MIRNWVPCTSRSAERDATTTPSHPEGLNVLACSSRKGETHLHTRPPNRQSKPCREWFGNGRRCPVSQEQTFLPKLQVYFADFPYSHCSTRLEVVSFGDLLRFPERFDSKVLQG